MFVQFSNELQEANDFIQHPITVFSAIAQFGTEQQFFESFELDELKRAHNPH